MTAIPIFGGPSKRTLIENAYGKTGRSIQFELDPDEYQLGQDQLDQLMAELLGMRGIDLSYNFPTTGVEDTVSEESGIPAEAAGPVEWLLAARLAPNSGKVLASSKERSTALSMLASSYQKRQSMAPGRATIVGAGNRYYGYRFFPVDTDPNEPV